MSERARIGVDIGGTFTDLVLLNSEGKTYFQKVASTPPAPEKAVLTGISLVLEQARLDPSHVSEVLHGTTVGSNTLLQKVGAKCGLITTKGFRDVLEIGRVRTPDMFNLTWDKPAPLVSRRNRLEIDERVNAQGEVLRQVDEAEMQAAIDHFHAEGVESVAICFLNSYLNGDNERAALELFQRLCPKIAVTASVEVLPEMREYERTSTTAVNAYVLPILKSYLIRLEQGIKSLGIDAPLLVSNSNGGLSGAKIAQEKPVFFISSGRSAGVVGASRLGQSVGEDNLIVFDMGGTTASASLIAKGQLTRTNEYEFRAGISTPSRFIKAGGYMMRVPTVDVAEVGNGAGSIAWLDDGGLLNVGPVSAGAEPGPVCYGIGGDKPTMTDANVALGYLPTELAGGTMKLDAEAARAAIKRDLADPLNIPVEEAAYGIREIANVNMARAIRAVTVERGVDPRDFTLLGFGGSGPVHACDLARALNIPRVLFPRAPGVFTAMGMIAGSVERYFIRPVSATLDTLDLDMVQARMAELEAEGRAALSEEGYGEDAMDLFFEMDLRFAGQDSEISVPLPAGFGASDIPALREAFNKAYSAMYGYVSEDEVETASLRLLARGRSAETLDFKSLVSDQLDSQAVALEKRNIYFNRDLGRVETPVYERAGFQGTAEGPMVLQSPDTTIVIPPNTTVALDDAQNIVVTLN